MRRVSTLFASLLLPSALFFAACGEDTSPATAATTPVPAADASGQPGDRDGSARTDGESAPDADDGGKKADASQPPTAVVRMATGLYHSCAVFASGKMKCWGRNENAELGLGDTNHRGDVAGEMGAKLPFVDVGAGRTVRDVAAGVTHTCVLLDDQTTKCFGENTAGALGQERGNFYVGDSADEIGDALPVTKLGTNRHATALSLGYDLSCALLDDGSVKCWGANTYGQLGLGDKTARGGTPSSMGDALLAVPLGTGRTAKAIAAGRAHVCVILDTNAVKCWGHNDVGQLGLGNTNNRGDDPGELGDALPTVDLGAGRTAKAISAEDKQTCVILDNDVLKCWGSKDFGQLGLGDMITHGDEPGEMGDALPAVNLGTGKKAVAIRAGYNHTCALLDEGSVKCWGVNAAAELGLGDQKYRGSSPADMGDSLPAIDFGPGRHALAITGTGAHCALLDEGSVKCWGNNFKGALGLGDTTDRGSSPAQMGANLPTVSLF